MTAETYYAPPEGSPPLTDPDAEERDLQERIRFNERVSQKATELKILDAARAQIAAEREAATDFTGLYLTRRQLLDLPDPEPLIEHVLPRHSYGVLRGRDHSFKSFVAIDWACCLATGKAWQTHHVEPTRVLYIAGEGAHGIAARLEAWEYAWGHNVPDDMFTVRSQALNLHQPGPAFPDLLRHIETAGYALVIVDTLRRVSGAADGNSSEMGAVIDNLDLVKNATDRGTVLVVAHTDKADHDSRGYSGIEDDADFVWHAKRDEMFLALENTKMKDGPDGRTLHLQATTTLRSLTLSDATGAPAPTSNESQLKVLDTMRDLFPDGAASGALKTAAGLADATFYRAIKDLKAAGHIANTGTVKRPFYEIPTLTESNSHDGPTDETDPDDNSHKVSPTDTPSDLGNSHNSHQVSKDSHSTLTGLTTLRSETTESESETNPSTSTPGDGS